MKPFVISHEHPDWFKPLFAKFEKVGVNFFLLQCSPQLEEMERFTDALIETKSQLA